MTITLPEDRPRDLIVLGEPLCGVIPPVGVPFRRSGTVQRATVGAEVNVAVAVARAGRTASVIGRVGDDLPGEAIRDDLIREGIDVRGLTTDPQSYTGALIREVMPAGGSRVSYLRQGSAGSRIGRSDLAEALIAEHRLAHVTGVTSALSESARTAALGFLQRARAAGLLTCVGVNYRSQLWPAEKAAPHLRALAAASDILIGGREESAMVFGVAAIPALLTKMAATGAGIVLLTDGSRPVHALIDGHATEVAVPATQARDVVGAGDAFTGAFLAGILGGLPAVAALDQALWAGARATASLGDWDGLPWGSGGRIDVPGGHEEVRR